MKSNSRAKQPISVFWFRRDLRLEDNRGLFEALNSEFPVLPIFIFDTNILEELENKADARVQFIQQQLVRLQNQFRKRQKGMRVFHDTPIRAWQQIVKEYNLKSAFTNRDYEPYAQQRDKEIYEFLQEHNIKFKGYKDQVIFEKSEILTQQNEAYSVFTPYAKNWKSSVTKSSFKHYKSEELLQNLLTTETEIPTLQDIGFTTSKITVPDYSISASHIKDYKKQRNFPAIDGTSKLSPHLRFGTISVREVCRKTKDVSEAFLNEIIWRDFYSQVLYHHPKVVTENYREKYDAVKWRNNEKEFQAWCDGKTGFPIVDAGMRQLNQTGWMHNRLRMITASFLCKDLLIDWRWGEAYFAKHLLDYDLASNNGGWQWAAGTGTDAAPYFRIFNPTSQLKKYDPEQRFIKKWLPEYGTDDYPDEIVNHKEARERTLTAYKTAIN